MEKKEEKCIFLEEEFTEEWRMKELILYGYKILPLASDGVLVLQIGGRDVKGKR